MRDVIGRVKRMWLFQRPPDYLPPRRIVTVLMYLAVVGTPSLTVVAYYLDAGADLRAADETRCEQRIEAREGSRARAFTNIQYVTGIVDSIDSFVGIPPDLRADLDRREQEERESVEEQLPPITKENCDES